MAENVKCEKVFGGYSLKFVDSIHERFICSICTKVMKDPHLMLCCGKKFCVSCLEKWFQRHGSECCRHCRADKGDANPLLHALEKGMKSEIESFKIHCTNNQLGCKWIGEIRDLDKHVHSKTGCGYCELKCPKKCLSREGTATVLFCKDFKEHLSKYCDLRQEKCQ